MKVALVNLTSGGVSGGYEKYLGAMLPRLVRDPRIAELTIFSPSSLPKPPVDCAVRTWTPGRDPGHRALRAGLQAVSPDVIFFPTARLIRCGATPTVVMVRNMEPLTVPFGGNTWLEGLRNVARAQAARHASRHASRVIAVSNHVRDFLVGRWRLAAERVGVVYHGIDAPDPGAASAPAPLAGCGRFLLTAGSVRPARGLEDAIRALADLRRLDSGATLVIAGGVDASGQPYAERMRRLARDCGVGEAVLWAGRLSAAELDWAYARCTAFVVTSRAEACPNVALEAMSHGARIVSTRQPPMPEFFGDAATYYTPTDAGELAARLRELDAIPDDGRSRAAVRARVAGFTWERTAAATVEELHRAVKRT